MSGAATPQNPVLPEDPFVIIGTRLSLDPTQEDAAVPSVGIGVAGGVVPLDADGQVPVQYLQKLIAYLGGTYTPPATTTPTTPTTPGTGTGTGTTPAPAQTISVATPAAQVAGVAFTVSGSFANRTPLALDASTNAGATWTGVAATISGGAFSFPLTIANAGNYTLSVRDRTTLVSGGSGAFTVAAAPATTTPTTPPAAATINDALTLADGAYLTDGDGTVLLFPTGEASTGGGTDTGGTTTTGTAVNATLTLADGATLADGDGVVLLFPVPADTGTGTTTGGTTTTTTTDNAVLLPDGGDLALPGGDTLVLPAA